MIKFLVIAYCFFMSELKAENSSGGIFLYKKDFDSSKVITLEERLFTQLKDGLNGNCSKLVLEFLNGDKEVFRILDMSASEIFLEPINGYSDHLLITTSYPALEEFHNSRRSIARIKIEDCE